MYIYIYTNNLTIYKHRTLICIHMHVYIYAHIHTYAHISGSKEMLPYMTVSTYKGCTYRQISPPL